MKIGILSDLHIDVHPYTPAVAPDCAVVIVAGDTCSRLDKGLPWMAEQVRQRGMELIYVPGNHDWYSPRSFGPHTCTIDGDVPKAKALADKLGIQLLVDGEAVQIGGVRFAGATLWTDYGVEGNAVRSMAAAAAGMTDHKVIRVKETGYRKFYPSDALAMHRRHLAALGEILATPFDGPTVVVTHHAPHPNSLQWGEPTEPLDGSYASDLTAFIERWRPALWVHGHVHQQRDYRIAQTRIVANPRGYVVTKDAGTKRERVEVENPAHDPSFAVEVPMRHRIDPLGRDTRDLPKMVAEIVEDRKSGRTDAAIKAEIDAVEEHWGLKPR